MRWDSRSISSLPRRTTERLNLNRDASRTGCEEPAPSRPALAAARRACGEHIIQQPPQQTSFNSSTGLAQKTIAVIIDQPGCEIFILTLWISVWKKFGRPRIIFQTIHPANPPNKSRAVDQLYLPESSTTTPCGKPVPLNHGKCCGQAWKSGKHSHRSHSHQ